MSLIGLTFYMYMDKLAFPEKKENVRKKQA